MKAIKQTTSTRFGLLIALLAMFVTACSKSVEFEIENMQSVEIFYSGEKPERILSNTSDLDDFQNLKLWLKANRSGWRTYYVTEPAGVIYVTADMFRLNIGQNSTILRSQSKKGRVYQLIKDTDISEFFFLQ